MAQTRLFFRAPKAVAAPAYAALEREFEDDGLPLAILEIDEAADVHEVSLYADEGIDSALRRMRAVAGDAEIGREDLPDIDWVARSLEGLKPVRVGRFLVHGSHDRAFRRAGDIAVEIEAGLAFGTGHHGTTAGCLEMIGRVVRAESPTSALDLGAGSAVLAIAAAKLARIPVLATDIDPVATRVARANIRLNGVGPFVEAATAPGFHHPLFAARGPFDLIVANILARPLMKLAPGMAQNLAPGGSIILSGILDAQRDAVLAAYVGQRFRHVRTTHRDGWVTLHLKR
ncbi:MAG: 50S ribosomal protein L11 methyltransferase [Rhizobiaceae bacterium]|nr:50S ribosomal protein L11 methyltransferase [Rhizobiaceae bacterium]